MLLGRTDTMLRSHPEEAPMWCALKCYPFYRFVAISQFTVVDYFEIYPCYTNTKCTEGKTGGDAEGKKGLAFPVSMIPILPFSELAINLTLFMQLKDL
jgi:hypothetical protein